MRGDNFSNSQDILKKLSGDKNVLLIRAREEY